jgi:membrane protein
VSLATLAFSVTGVFGELQADLNKIWDVKADPGRSGVWPWLQKRLLSLGTFVSVAFMMIVSLALSAAVTAASEWTGDVLPGADVAWQTAAFVLGLGISALVFALVFKVLPDLKLAWRDVAVGGVLTAVLFSIGRWLIGIYLARSSLGSAYGAAGSLIVLLAWVYYASLVLFAGAELTQVLASRRGRRLQTEAGAIVVERKEEPKPTAVRA